MPESNTVTMNDVMASVGDLFLHWGVLENEVKRRRGDLSSMHTFHGLEDARRIRNLIAHGIFEATAYPTEGSYLLCKSQDNVIIRVTFDEIGAAIEAFRRAKIAVWRSATSPPAGGCEI